MRILLGAGVAVLLLFFWSPGMAKAQNTVPNGDFEVQDLGPWTMTGDNGWTTMKLYDTDGDGVDSWCWKRKPGTDNGQPFGNGGLEQEVYLIQGVTYDFSCWVAYLCTC